jgi:hypothetical protein
MSTHLRFERFARDWARVLLLVPETGGETSQGKSRVRDTIGDPTNHQLRCFARLNATGENLK